MRLKRKHRKLRAFRKRRELSEVENRTRAIRPDDILVFSTLRNERIRLPYFLKYYRDLGVSHFLIVDNGSDDGGREYLAEQEDVSIWSTDASYKKSHFGVDWLNWLQWKYGHGHWTLVVDPDEFLVYPFCDTRPLRALTDWLDSSGVRSFGAMLLDMYPKGQLDAQPYRAGQDPFEIACWFDSGNYMIKKNPYYGNLWIQGGARTRAFFRDDPANAPALNKIPLVKWDRAYAYLSSTHTILPRGLNQVYDEWGGEKASGCLLHAKFLDTFSAKAEEELKRRQHYAGGHEYRAYHQHMKDNPDLWCKWSEKYINWRQLEILGIMSKGNWA
ncbi:glycosyltransferase family 2 protein [Aliiroseovarius crassostreae]|uniref:Glycosyltransferase family 2 protein n=1 Tax=Aliiroseovarius crassostreae TaxID=154981 RepID=A0A9Q9HEA1_9RHOB|nr:MULTISPECIES: glycosyltransferase family 2 protein [Aliiroseovarius]UWP90727.1 glycosyltransferase family 2 protein [Aliiroseovarius crassostreae]UWP93875.1 glycosyltransferase family 2 protein [Aliiroseovarius crassostreae]UWP97017.1 glycosyltransferase family 2 protein [Aliiroseovarius crassostreae]UWQ00182.1 glycosyltransferase family 2 protein [Aliiroseovarius crassostreae]UWQ03386.1 glycosyltransferase family 2 protein [Aliiroseovarius crassostreae]